MISVSDVDLAHLLESTTFTPCAGRRVIVASGVDPASPQA